MSLDSSLPIMSRQTFSARNTVVLLIVTTTLLSLFALQLDVPVTWHSGWISLPNNDTNAVISTSAFETGLDTKYKLAAEMVAIPNTEDIKHLHHNYKWYTEAKLRALTACLARGDCHPNADKIAIFATFHCHWAVYNGYHGGEGIWCLGMMDALQKQGFTVLHGGENDWEYIDHIHRQFPDMVRIILSETGEETRHGTLQQYRKTKENPLGIPEWKYFMMSYYPAGWATNVGHAWVVCAEPSVGDEWDVSINPATSNAWVRTGEEDLHIFASPERFRFTYLGYAVHPQPSEAAVVPWEQRPNHVWLMGKYAHYLHNGDQRVYDMDFFERAHNELSKEFPGFQFVGAIQDTRGDDDKAKWGEIPKVIKNYGKLGPKEFEQAFGESKLMLGLGSPPISPSPYQALAKAVPFANPHRLREGGNSNDDRTWSFVQHDSLQRVPEPYVYQVEAFNYTSFVDTIRRALKQPIGQFRFERMKDDVVQRRLAAWVMTDWRAVAERSLEGRVNGSWNEGAGVGLFEL